MMWPFIRRSTYNRIRDMHEREKTNLKDRIASLENDIYKGEIGMITRQIDQVEKHLKKYGHITSWQAIQKYRVTRLSAVIYELRKTHTITTQHCKNKTGKGSYAKYLLW